MSGPNLFHSFGYRALVPFSIYFRVIMDIENCFAGTKSWLSISLLLGAIGVIAW